MRKKLKKKIAMLKKFKRVKRILGKKKKNSIDWFHYEEMVYKGLVTLLIK